MRYPLIGGSYQARSVVANNQRCVNYFPETNRKDSPTPITHYQRPGFRPLVTGPALPVRGLYRASNGNGYAVIGGNVYSLDSNWVLTAIGALTTYPVPGFSPSYPVSMTDNGFQIMLVDASSQGYTIDLASNTFAQINDPTGLFLGARRCDVLDGFIVWAPQIPGTNRWGSTLLDQIEPFDGTYFASKNNYPDPMQAIVVNKHEIILLGTVMGEIWYDAGGALFPFAELPGASIEHGCVAPLSVATADINVFWLGQDRQGQGVVFQQRGYETKRISNHALEYQIRKIARSRSIDDAIAYTYQMDGHYFYVLSFISGNQTWVYDLSMGDPDLGWHQRGWTDPNGALQRDRGNVSAFLYGKNVVGDWENGTIYDLDPDYYKDTIGGIDRPISFIRTFPQIQEGMGPGGQPIQCEGKRIQIRSFIVDIECGEAPLDADGNPARLWFRCSFDRGKTWTTGPLQSNGAPGEYETSPQWPILGAGRFPILELEHNIAGPAALNGAWVDAEILGT